MMMTDGGPTLTSRGCPRSRCFCETWAGSEIPDAREPTRLSNRVSLSLTAAHVATPKSRKTSET